VLCARQFALLLNVVSGLHYDTVFRADDAGEEEVMSVSEDSGEEENTLENVWHVIEAEPIVSLEDPGIMVDYPEPPHAPVHMTTQQSSSLGDSLEDRIRSLREEIEPVEQLRGQPSIESSIRMEDMGIRAGGRGYARMVDEPDAQSHSTDSNATAMEPPDQTEDAIKQLRYMIVQECTPDISMEQVYNDVYGKHHHEFCKNVLGLHATQRWQRALYFGIYGVLLAWGFCSVRDFWQWSDILFALGFLLGPTVFGLLLTWRFQRFFWVKMQVWNMYLKVPRDKTKKMAKEMRRNFWFGVGTTNILYVILWVLYINEVKHPHYLVHNSSFVPYPDDVLKRGRCWIWGAIGEHVILLMLYGCSTHVYLCKLAKAFDERWLPVIGMIRVRDDFGLRNAEREERVTMALQPYLEIRRRVSYSYTLTLVAIFLLASLYSILIACYFRKWIIFSDFPIPTPFGLLYRTENPPQIYAVASVGYFCMFARVAHVYGYPFTATKLFISTRGLGLSDHVLKLLEAPIMFFHIPLTHSSFKYVIYGLNLLFLVVLLIVFLVP